MLSDEEIEALRTLAMGASAGPWRVSRNGTSLSWWIVRDTEREANVPVAHIGANHRESVQMANAAYIAAMYPEVLLVLLDEIARLRAENDRLKAARLRPETVFKIRDTLTDYREELRAIWEGQRDYLIEDVNEALADLDRAYPPEAV